MPRRMDTLEDPEALTEPPTPRARRRWRPFRRMALWFWGWFSWIGARLLALMFVLVFLFSFINPPTTWTIIQGQREFPGRAERAWVGLDAISPHMVRAVVAAEDANFCNHWGFDMVEIRRVIASGSSRGASTISQQTVKNAYLWQGRSWLRKALEAGVTPLVEAVWSKKRILEVYLNIAEFDEGVFGVEAAAEHYFGVSAKTLSATQAARLAAILPDPKDRSASRPSAFVERRASQIRDGAATIARDGRADCFE